MRRFLAQGLGRVALVDRLELAEAGGGQMLGGQALLGEELHHRERARGRKLPIRGEQDAC